MTAQSTKMNNLIKLLNDYKNRHVKMDVEDIVWEAVKTGLTAVPMNGVTYLCKNGSWLIRLDKNGGVEFSKELSYMNLTEDVI